MKSEIQDPPLPRDFLPEDYGPGQRQYDIASAVMKFAEDYSYPVAALAATTAFFFGGWLAAVPVAIGVWFLVLHAPKKALKAASDAWELERSQYEARFRR